MNELKEVAVSTTEITILGRYFVPEVIFGIEKSTNSESLEDIIKGIKEEVSGKETDVSTTKSRKAIASLSGSVARTKVAIDKAGKALTETQRQMINSVNEQRKYAKEKLQEIQDSVRKPLTDWEELEKSRVDAHQSALAKLEEIFNYDSCETPVEIEARQKRSKEFHNREWEEFEERAIAILNKGEMALSKDFDAATQREKEQIELAESRKKAEESRLEIEKVKREIEKANFEAQEALRREKEALVQAEKSAREAVELVEREKEQQRLREARIQREELCKKAEAEKTIRNAEERKLLEDSMISEAVDSISSNTGIYQENARKIVNLIKMGKVPHIFMEEAK